jgi:hypothetical protein
MLKQFVVALVVFVMQSRGLAQADSSSSPGLEEVKERVEGMNESLTEMRGILDALKKIKVSGYLLSQFRYTDLINQAYPIGNFSGGSFPANTKNQFQIREGRFKLTYDNTLTQAVFQIDIAPSGVTVKDAYLSLTEPWLQSFGMQVGIFDRPFGYEISFSSSARESAERSRLFQTLFPGERDLGAKLFYAPQLGPLSLLRMDIGVFNGTGANANEFDNFKDLIGHATVQLPLGESSPVAIDLGVSGYLGNVRSNSKDIYTNGEPVPGVNGFVKSTDTVNVGKGVGRIYRGADLQFYYDVPSLGGLILRGEYIYGHQPGTSSSTVSPSSSPTSALYKRKFSGWYVNLVQNLGGNDQIVLKYDVYDPNTNVKASDFSPTSALTVADIKYSTLGFGLVHYWDANIKFLLYYELIKNELLDAAKVPVGSSLSPYTADVRDNVLTLRVVYKF